MSLYQVVIYCPFLTVCCFSLSLYSNAGSCHITAGDSRNSFSDTLFWSLIDCTKFLASSSEMQKERILHTNAVREKQTEAKRNRDSERERERDWVRETLSLRSFTLQPGPNPCSVQLRLCAGWRFTSASWTRLESDVKRHHHFKCIICLRHFQTTDLCSRHQMTHSGTWAALSPALELSWASLTTVPEPTSEMQCPVPSLEISPRINGPNISHRAANHSSFHDSLIFKLKKRCQILPNKTVLLTD